MFPAWLRYLRPHRHEQTPAIFRLILAALSGAILSLSYRGSFSSCYAWFCIALLLSSILGARAWVAFSCGFLHGLIFVLATVSWIAETLSVHGGMSAAAGWGVLLLIAAVWAAAIGVFAWIVQRLSWRSIALALLGAPFLWISTEVFRTYLPEISFAWSLLGYPAAGNPAVVQLTTITGIYGVSFLVAAFNALLLWGDFSKTPAERKKRWAIVGAVTSLMLAVTIAGSRFVPKAEAHHLARVVQPNFPENLQYAG